MLIEKIKGLLKEIMKKKMTKIKITGDWDGEPIWRKETPLDNLQEEILKRRMELRKQQFDNEELDRLQRSKLPRKTKLWILDKNGFNVDFSPYDAEGRPEPDERDAI